MTEILDAPSHVAAVRVSGQTGDADTQAVWAVIDAVSQTHDPSAVFAEIGWVWGLAPGQFEADVRDGLAELVERGTVARVAIVSDAYSRRAVVRSQASQLEGVGVYVFPPAARKAAMSWAADGVAPTTYVA